MAKSILDIIIRTVKEGGGDKETVKGLSDIKAGLAQAGVIAAAFVAAYYAVDKVLDATVGTFVKYADQVRETSRLTGVNAEDTSRLIQMADDLGISYESLQKSMWFASKNGMDVNRDSLAALADEYVALQSPSERAEFLAKNFGKSGAEMGKMLEKGGDGVRALNDAISGNLVLTEASLQKARENQMAVDQLSDAWEGYKIAVGVELAPVVTKLLNQLTLSINMQDNMSEALKKTNGNHNEAIKLASQMTAAQQAETDKILLGTAAVKNQDDAMTSVMDAINGYGAAIDQVDYSNLLSSTMSIQDAMTGFAEKSAEINGKIAELDPASADYAETLSGLEGELKKNTAAQELWSKKLVYSMVQARLAVGGINSGEFAFLIELGVQMGLVDQKSADMAQNLNENINSLDFSDGEAAIAHVKGTWQSMLNMPANKDLQVFLDIKSRYDGPVPICFVAGTPVSTPSGTRAIEDIRVGHFVSVKTSAGVVTARVTNLNGGVKNQIVVINTSDGQTFQCTPDHPWQLEDGNFRFASDLCPGDKLNSDHGEVYVLDTNLRLGEFKVYTFGVNHPDHTFMVGGLVVHNKVLEDRATQSAMFGGMSNSFLQSTSSSTVNSGTTINVYNPVFNVGNGRGVVEVLEALR
jgi:hypothetical protein